ncbi:ubiquitin carboxyl-terminal hydrolase [Thecamonas trahens ATCC 50062]|uniref:Ubiquitin carboxyl-terminal hydrolase n=1 Tax=Thecamonas trahens ATCC 50062 TaxID=461836 RepID=A0A0L0DV25_THETB|nr:ubiquitin carboxyl-terminal hydrolase [Thecamonas trahens ATCC 50062]KNC56047.1 ubiquitin carboxyl-terminal hydrolase [Thecamonas trahens ATCC 50062]|eukprot:XP_013761091.1 ubiquitin carboxyl-terminal hydrolase [Thecamonas trahens ATCC 50062]
MLGAPADEAVDDGVPGVAETVPVIDEVTTAMTAGSGFVAMRKDVREKVDFEVIPEAAWRMLQEAHGDGSGPELCRKVVARGSGNLGVELHPLVLHLISYTSRNGFGPRTLVVRPRECAMADLVGDVRAVFGWSSETPLAMWRSDEAAPTSETAMQRAEYTRVALKAATLDDAELLDGALVVVVSGPLAESGQPPWRAAGTGATVEGRAGLAGLRNLGNTCFMNATLQALSNTPQLVAYFASGAFVRDVNVENKLGTGGALAAAWADLVRELWLGPKASVAPSKFKRVLGQLAPQFSDFKQQDAHELFSFVLDGLHEDVNLVTDKPVTEKLELEDGQDEAWLAGESWATHLQRNKSAVVDLFHFQLKSTVVCPQCERVSVTFDPACALSVPLPSSGKARIGLTMVFASATSPPLKACLELDAECNVGHLRHQLACLTGVPSGQIVIGAVDDSRLGSTFGNKKALSKVPRAGGDGPSVVAWELAPGSSRALYVLFRRRDTRVCGGCSAPATRLRCKQCKVQYYCSREHQVADWKYHKKRCGVASTPPRARMVIFGTPLVIGHDLAAPQLTGRALYATIEAAIAGRVSKAWANGPSSPPPYLLRLCDADGISCAVCEPEARCRGCAVAWDADEPVAVPKRARVVVDFGGDDGGSSVLLGAAAPAVEIDESAARGTGITLGECVAQFEASEVLDEHNEWYCSVCAQHQQATLQMKMWSAPRVLVVHLKRFRRRGWTGFFGTKVTDAVDFDETLDLRPFVAGDVDPGTGEPFPASMPYVLYAVVNHMGNMYSGHYTAYARSPRANLSQVLAERDADATAARIGEVASDPCHEQWWLYNDSTVSRVSAARVLSDRSHAYMLFYMRAW